MSPSLETKCAVTKERQYHIPFPLFTLCKTLLIFLLASFACFLFYFPDYAKMSANSHISVFQAAKGKNPLVEPNTTEEADDHQPRTDIKHLVFGVVGSEATWHHRKSFGEAWWRPNITRGYLYLDQAPGGDLLPWSSSSPSYRVSDDLADLIKENDPKVPRLTRIVHAILEALREEEEEEYGGSFRWLVIGDDDTVFFIDNLVDVLSEFDHTKYYYIGGGSESILSDHRISFNMAFGGGGFALSYPLAKAFAETVEGCLKRYRNLAHGDLIEMSCFADLGVNLSPHRGFHQIDLHGDISGLLSSHPNTPLLSLHHFDAVEPIFPGMDRLQSIRHLMKAGNTDQSRLMQQTICYHRQYNWSISVSWGYSIHIYEKIMPRSLLQLPIRTFDPWIANPDPPFFMFNTRSRSNINDSCEAPHVFFFESVEKLSNINLTLSSYYRFSRRELGPCLDARNSADFITHIHVYSPPTKRIKNNRCECCDIDNITKGMKNAIVKFRECMLDEIMA